MEMSWNPSPVAREHTAGEKRVFEREEDNTPKFRTQDAVQRLILKEATDKRGVANGLVGHTELGNLWVRRAGRVRELEQKQAVSARVVLTLTR
jgi:hypothetical protein